MGRQPIWLSYSHEEAMENAREKEGLPTVLEVNLPEDWILDKGEAGTYLSWRDIPPEHIRLLMVQYVPPEEKYRIIARTKRGSLVVVTRDEDEAKIEIANFEDMNDISNLLNATGIVWKSHSGISGIAWEAVPPYLRGERSPETIRLNIYPGRTVVFDFAELERVMGGLDQIWMGKGRIQEGRKLLDEV